MTTDAEWDDFISKLRNGGSLVAHPDTIEQLCDSKSIGWQELYIALDFGRRIIPHPWCKVGQMFAVAKYQPPDFEFTWDVRKVLTNKEPRPDSALTGEDGKLSYGQREQDVPCDEYSGKLGGDFPCTDCGHLRSAHTWYDDSEEREEQEGEARS